MTWNWTHNVLKVCLWKTQVNNSGVCSWLELGYASSVLRYQASHLDQDWKPKSPNSQAFQLRPKYTTSFPEPSVFRGQIVELLSFHIVWTNSCNAWSLISLSLSVSASILTLLVPFLWRTLTNTGREVLTLPFYKIRGLQGPQNVLVFTLAHLLWMLPKAIFLVCLRDTGESCGLGLRVRIQTMSWEAGSHQRPHQADQCGGWGAFCQLLFAWPILLEMLTFHPTARSSSHMLAQSSSYMFLDHWLLQLLLDQATSLLWTLTLGGGRVLSMRTVMPVAEGMGLWGLLPLTVIIETTATYDCTGSAVQSWRQVALLLVLSEIRCWERLGARSWQRKNAWL